MSGARFVLFAVAFLAPALAFAGEPVQPDPSYLPELLAAARARSLAKDRGWKIVAVIDTHVHADHISRARPLAKTPFAKNLTTLLNSGQGLALAIVLQEILGPPTCKQRAAG